MTRQQIALPWRDTGEEWRLLHLNHLMYHYGEDFDIILADSEGDWNVSAARNAGVRQTESDIAIIIDADNLIPLNQVHKAIEWATEQDAMVKPFQTFGYWTEEVTAKYYTEPEPVLDNSIGAFIDPVSDSFPGGAYVCKKSIWDAIGGADERFVGWGGEDDAIHLACRNRGVPVLWVPGYDYHLYHPAHRVASKDNLELLFNEYVCKNLEDGHEVYDLPY